MTNTNTKSKRVEFDRTHGLIHINGRYPIGLDELTTTGRVLDFIFQIADKPWADHCLVGEFVEAIEEASEFYCNKNAQGVLCPGGKHRRVDWLAGSSEPFHNILDS